MKITISLNDKIKSGIRKSFILKIAKETLKCKEFEKLKNNEIEISFAAVSEKEIAKINESYRHKKTSTDVLSFSEFRNLKEILKAGDKNIYLGEIIVCYNYIKRNALREKISVKQETARIISHGILHLLGFKHSKKMFKAQNKVSNNF